MIWHCATGGSYEENPMLGFIFLCLFLKFLKTGTAKLYANDCNTAFINLNTLLLGKKPPGGVIYQ